MSEGTSTSSHIRESPMQSGRESLSQEGASVKASAMARHASARWRVAGEDS